MNRLINKSREEKINEILVQLDEKKNNKNIASFEKERFDLVYTDFINRSSKVDFYLTLGNTARHILLNLEHFQLNILHGWNDLKLTKYGWVEYEKFEIVEKIHLGKSLKYKHLSNDIEIGVSPNGLFQYGYSIGAEYYGGASSGINVYGKRFNTKEEALIDVLTLFKSIHLKNDSSETSKMVLANVEKRLSMLLLVDQNKQLLLF